MSLDLSKLSPAPWRHNECWYETIADKDNHNVLSYDNCDDGVHGYSPSDLDFMALARNDLDVKQRRGWHTEKCTESDEWFVPQLAPLLILEHADFIDVAYQKHHDVGLLTKADRWYAKTLET